MMRAMACRDCPACTRPALVRWLLLYPLLVPVTALFVRPLVTTCPQCGHVLARHRSRAILG